MTAIYDTLVDLLVNRFQVNKDEIKPDVTFEDLDMDSLFLVELLLVLQNELGVEIPEEAATPRDTISQAAELIAGQLASMAQDSS
jgi:acyl carrier protein